MEMLPERLTGGDMSPKELLDFNQQMVKIFLGGGEVNSEANGEVLAAEQSPEQAEGVMQQTGDVKVTVSDVNGLPQGAEVSMQTAADTLEMNLQAVTADGKAAVLQEGVSVQTVGTEHQEAILQENILVDSEHEGKNAMSKTDVQEVSSESKQQVSAQTVETAKSSPDMIKNLLSDSQLQQLSNQLEKIPELSKNPVLFPEGTLSADITSKELLQLLEQSFSSDNPFSRQALSSLVSSKAYRTLVRNVMEQQWLLKPEELKTEHKVEELYERLDRQLNQMEKVLKEFGQNTQQLTDTAANVRENIQFMNQLNQTYAYVQIPLKLAGQNAHSDLYVYTDKRKKREKDGEITAFLHLDLDHLGSTDVSIKLHQKKVATNFYLKDDVSYQLLLEHLDELERRLEEKGYHAKIHVENQEEKVNFVEDLLKQGAPSAGGMVHRYSFDVRA